MTEVTLSLLAITLNVNGLNFSGERLAEWIKTYNATIC